MAAGKIRLMAGTVYSRGGKTKKTAKGTLKGFPIVVRNKPGKTFRQKVKDIVNGSQETKFVTQTTAGNQPLVGWITNFSASARNIIPAIARQQQTEQLDYQFEGNELKPIKIQTDMYFAVNDSSARNLIVTVWVLEHKSAKYFPAVGGAADSANFLKSGIATGMINYQAQLQQNGLPINDDNFRVLKKYSFQICKNAGQESSGSNPSNLPIVSRQSFKKITYNYTCKGNLKFTDNVNPSASLLYPNNKAPFFYVGYANQDGSPIAQDAAYLNMTSISKMWFKDA